jgi:hypothetical protein
VISQVGMGFHNLRAACPSAVSLSTRSLLALSWSCSFMAVNLGRRMLLPSVKRLKSMSFDDV